MFFTSTRFLKSSQTTKDKIAYDLLKDFIKNEVLEDGDCKMEFPKILSKS